MLIDRAPAIGAVEDRNTDLELGVNFFCSQGAAALGLGNVMDVAEMVDIRWPLPVYRPDASRSVSDIQARE